MLLTYTTAEPGAGPGNDMLRAFDLRGPAGRLEALLNHGSADAPYAALVCHPHPLGGGTMHNKVVYNVMKVLNAPEWGLSWPVLRFNFRGAGLSKGKHHGMAEAGDVAAALVWLRNEFKKPVVVVGFSFGAAMALIACCGPSNVIATNSNLCAVAALGLPTSGFGHRYHYPFLSGCRVPKLFVSGSRDPYTPSAELKKVVEAAAEPKKVVLIPGADHSFTGQLDVMQQALSGWLKEQLL
jgi:alpha/beta superfamily hydrolase